MQFSTKTILISTLFFFGSSSVLASPIASQETTPSNEERSNTLANIDLNIPDLIQAGIHARGTEDDEVDKRLIIPAFLSHLISGKEGQIQARDEDVEAVKRLIIPSFLSHLISGKEGQIAARDEDELAAAKRLIPGLFEKLFGGGKEALEAMKRGGLNTNHPLVAWNNGPCDTVGQCQQLEWKDLPGFSTGPSARDLLSSQLTVPDLLDLHAAIKASKRQVEEENENAKRLLLPLLLSKLGGKEGEDQELGKRLNPIVSAPHPSPTGSP